MKKKLMNGGPRLPTHVKNEYEAKRKNLIMTLIIAYHNAGVESEYLRKYDEAEHHFSNGSEVGLKYFGKMDEMTRLLQKSLSQVKRAKAVQSVQKWNKGRKSPSDVLSLTSNNSKDLKFTRTKVLKETSSEDKRFGLRNTTKSPVAIPKHHKNNMKSQDYMASRPTKRTGNKSVIRRSPQKLLSNKRASFKPNK